MSADCEAFAKFVIYIHIVIYGFALTVHLIWNFVFDSVQLHSNMYLTVILIHS